MHSLWNRNIRYTRTRNKLKRAGLRVDVRIVASGLTEREAFDLEKERIAFWRSIGVDLVNLTDGGDGMTPTEETRAKMRASSARRWSDPDQRKRAAEIAKDRATPDRIKKMMDAKPRFASPETRAKMSASIQKFYANNPEARQKRAERVSGEKNHFYGKKHSPETLQRIADKKRGSKMTEETREKMRVAQSERRRREAAS